MNSTETVKHGSKLIHDTPLHVPKKILAFTNSVLTEDFLSKYRTKDSLH